MNLEENIQRIKSMMGLNEVSNPYSITWLEPTREYFSQELDELLGNNMRFSKNEYNDHLFMLVDGNNYNVLGDYPEELQGDLPEPCYESPDIKDPRFNTIVFYEVFAEDIENYLGPQMNWKESLLNLINDKFGCKAWALIII